MQGAHDVLLPAPVSPTIRVGASIPRRGSDLVVHSSRVLGMALDMVFREYESQRTVEPFVSGGGVASLRSRRPSRCDGLCFRRELRIGDEDLDVTLLDGHALVLVLEAVCRAGDGKNASGIDDGYRGGARNPLQAVRELLVEHRQSAVVGEALQEVEPGRLRAPRYEKLGAGLAVSLRGNAGGLVE